MGGDGERIQRFLTEFRMMVAAVGVLIGFLLHATFTEPFLRLPAPLRAAHVAALLSALVSFVALLFPASLHRLASETTRADEFLRMARRAVGVAFVSLGAALTLSLLVQATRAFSLAWGVAAALVAALLAFVGWFVLPRRLARRLGAPAARA